MEPETEHGIFNWVIENFLLCLPHKTFTIESSKFIYFNSSWLLKLTVQHAENEMLFIVRLCRSKNGNSGEIRSRVALSVKSADNVFANFESEHLFENGDVIEVLRFRTTWQDFWPVYGDGEDENDVVLVECNMISISNHPENHNNQYIHPNLMTLLKGSSNTYLVTQGADIPPYNACLIAEGREIPVHKEILCAYSPAFEEQFGSGNLRLEVFFRADSVEAMLRYMYSGNIGKVFINGILPPLDLYDCALEYQVFGLMKCLTPWMMNVISSIVCRKVKFSLDYPDFSRLLTEQSQVFRRKISEDIELTIYFSFDDRCEVSMKVQLSTKSTKPFSASGLFYILDFEGNKLLRKQHLFYLNGGKDCSFNFDIQKQTLIAANLMMQRIFLRLQCEFKLGSSKEPKLSKITDVEYFICHRETIDDYFQSGKSDLSTNSCKDSGSLNNNFAYQCGQGHHFVLPYANFVLTGSHSISYCSGNM